MEKIIISGSCKKDFNNWGIKDNRFGLDNVFDFIQWFHVLPESMQYGVYVDFFDSVKIDIDLYPILDYNKKFYTKVLSFIIQVRKLGVKEKTNSCMEFDTRHEARHEAIKQADKIYNENN